MCFNWVQSPWLDDGSPRMSPRFHHVICTIATRRFLLVAATTSPHGLDVPLVRAGCRLAQRHPGAARYRYPHTGD
jgi:hypothetical protein